MREEPIISGAWIKAALVVLVAGALGAGAYLLASDVDINLPDLDLNTGSTATTLEDTALQDTTIGQQEALTTPPPKPKQPKPAQPAPPPPAGPSIQQLQQLNRCIASAGGDIDRITACFDRFAR
jgi:hypothetical protein